MTGLASVSPRIAQVNLIAADLPALAAFYRKLFSGHETPSVNPDGYRGIDIGGSVIGISAAAVRDALNLQQGCMGGCAPLADSSFVSIELIDRTSVDTKVQTAVQLGATLLDGPGITPFNWYCATLRDPEGHAFRVFSQQSVGS
ncbi:MAG: hypothetical protein JJ920_10755 [Roseitalea sp.]|jgi:predicted enzyme related to lactoylglutathione lyase|nr:hypothetical protein [Roseitalea sp.]MBO6721626.1 hypothetical protein [Roseitalea sp.]MBO6743382.1 hypothetical protein [Roseitalea sp.]